MDFLFIFYLLLLTIKNNDILLCIDFIMIMSAVSDLCNVIYQSFSAQPCLIFLLQSHSGVTLTIRSHSGVTLIAPESLRSYSVCSEVTPELLWLLWSHSGVTLAALESLQSYSVTALESLCSYFGYSRVTLELL